MGAVVALLLHAPVLAALRPADAHERTAAESAASRRAAARIARAALLRTAEADVASGRATLGETLIRLGWLDGVEESGTDAADRVDLERALVAYRAMLTEVRTAVAGGAPVERAIVDAVAHDGRAGRYKRMYPRLVDALVHGGGNCVAQSTLATTLAHDAGRSASATMRVYANHVAPDVAGFRFGMAKRCNGPGEPLAAKDLLTAYAGAWELANLMTRPSSQVGALQRWSKKPVDMRLDVIDALPCASETFLAQLDGMDLPAARTLRDACEVRARIDKETCALDDALAHARRSMRSRDRDANDLAEAVLVRHLSARCRTSEFGVAGRRWATSKPEPIARALASRLAGP